MANLLSVALESPRSPRRFARTENAKKKPGQGVSVEALYADAPRSERARHKGREALFYLCVIVF